MKLVLFQACAVAIIGYFLWPYAKPIWLFLGYPV